MTLLPLLLVLQAPRLANPPRFIPPPSAQELRRVQAFIDEAYQGLVPGALAASRGMNVEFKVEAPDWTHPDTRIYNFSYANVGVDVESGWVVFYGGGPYEGAGVNGDGRILPRRVTDRDARAIVQRLYTALDLPGAIECQVKDLEGGNSEDLEVWYTPVAGGVPYVGESGVMNIDRQTGLLHYLIAARRRTEPPISLALAVPLEAARAAALRAAVDLRGESLTEAAPEPCRLVVWPPDEKPRKDEPAAVAAARKAHRGVLAYIGGFWAGEQRGMVRVVVDARTGAVLAAFEPFGALPGGNGGVNAQRAPGGKPPLPPSAPRPWQVAFGAGPLSVPALATLVPATGRTPTAGTKLTLTDGKAAFPALYDPATGLVGISGRAYRPGPALAALLKRRAKV